MSHGPEAEGHSHQILHLFLGLFFFDALTVQTQFLAFDIVAQVESVDYFLTGRA